MKVHYDLAALPRFKNAVVTIGTFDGVHLGHRQIIQQVREEAHKIGGETVIITFHPHPRKVISSIPGDIRLITTPEEKIELLEQAGIDHLVVVPFNYAFANQTAEQYIKEFLFKHFNPHTVILGYDHHFGKSREGDYHLMDQYGESLGFKVKEIPGQVMNEVAISSTRIRESLLASDIETANSLLGYHYFFEGLVIEGNKLGRTLGYPTANLHIESDEKLIPGNGVYTVKVMLPYPISNHLNYKGMMNIGVRPTVDGTKRMIEVNIFDFDADIYGDVIRVEIIYYLRGEVKFNGLEELKVQLKADEAASREKLKGS